MFKSYIEPGATKRIVLNGEPKLVAVEQPGGSVFGAHQNNFANCEPSNECHITQPQSHVNIIFSIILFKFFRTALD